MDNTGINRITGHVNPQIQQFQIIATADTTVNFYGFMALDGDAVVSTLTNADLAGSSALSYLGDDATAYQGVYHPGSFKNIQLTSGKVILYLSEQT